MKASSNYFIVLVTAPDLKTARHIAKRALGTRLVACANLIPKIESHYWWRGKIDSGAEVLILFKTARSHLAELEQLILSTHPYDTPEFIALSLSRGNERYLIWLEQSVRRQT